MAKTQKKNKKLSRSGRIVIAVLLALVLGLAVLACYGVLNASVVRVRRATVVLPDLPPAFEGTRVLYASDIDLCGINTAERCGALFDRLQSLEPDLLILGGDYTSPSIFATLNRGSQGLSQADLDIRERERFFQYLDDFQAPLGKFSIASPEDGDHGALSGQLEQHGIVPLFNAAHRIEARNNALWLVGISANSSASGSAGLGFRRGDCVISALYSPELLPQLMTGEAGDGGRWCDLVLSGHTHGGQILLFGKSVLPLTEREYRFLSGWRMDSGVPILTTQGVGCEGANLRIGTAPEVWLVTLQRQKVDSE